MKSKKDPKTSINQPIQIIWFRNDLRIDQNPALSEALKNKEPILPIYILDNEAESPWEFGGATKWWLHHSLVELDKNLKRLNLSLNIFKGDSEKVFDNLLNEFPIKRVFWNRRYEHHIIKRDQHLKESLVNSNIETVSFNGSLLLEPWEIYNQQKKPYLVFTPFYKHFLNIYQTTTPSITNNITKRQPITSSKSINISSLSLLPNIKWDSGLINNWNPGESNAKNNLHTFKNKITDYSRNRDIPSVEGTSQLSPTLHFGEISPKQIWNELYSLPYAQPYLRQIIWREFAHHLMFHFPSLDHLALRESFRKFPWIKNEQFFNAWKMGQTGIPIVDAGMRQLWHTGWMHNRVRMIVGSFLTKNLLIDWQYGAKWFWDTLVDANLANNSFGWQWIAGCGADAAPYFRIFNPILQGNRFDPNGIYVKKWVPELKNLPSKWIHEPWMAPKEVLLKAKLTLGNQYPSPIVDLKGSRLKALKAYEKIKSK